MVFIQKSLGEMVLIGSEGESRSVMSDSLQPHGLFSPWNSPLQNTGVNSRSLLQGILPPQGLNPGLLHHRQSLYQLSHQGRSHLVGKDCSDFSSDILEFYRHFPG